MARRVIIAKNITSGPAVDVYINDMGYPLIPASEQEILLMNIVKKK